MSTRSSPLIAAETLAEQLGEPAAAAVRLPFRSRGSGRRRARVSQSHLPGAHYVHLERDLSGPVLPARGVTAAGDGRLRGTAARLGLRRRIARRRLRRRQWRCMRRGSGGCCAGRACDSALVLDGGYARWRALGLPVTTEVPHRPCRATSSLIRGPISRSMPRACSRSRPIPAAECSTRALPSGSAGEIEPIDAVAGHVPGAVNHPLTESLAADGRFRPPHELRRAFDASLGAVPPSHVVAMCGSGVTACHLLLAIEQAGLPGARLYPGSWSEWIRDPRGRSHADGRTVDVCYLSRQFFRPRGHVDSTARRINPATGWKIEDSLDLYGVKAWGNGYFGINDCGPRGRASGSDHRARDRSLRGRPRARGARPVTPVVVRFSDILRHRLKRLARRLRAAIAENDYRNRYAAVFPIKVNQQRLVVEEVYGYGREFGFGLEVGSKPELLAVMAMTEGESERMIICNGFKDDSYIEAVILATKLGRTIIPVVENFAELQLILKHATQLRGAPAHRRARQARDRGRRQVARIVRREIQVRPVRHRDPRALPHAQGARHGGLPAARPLPSRQPAAGHPPRQGCRQRAGARLRGAEADGRRAAATSTSAAGSASTTTAAAPTTRLP